MFIFIGTYSARSSRGIYLVDIQPATGAMRLAGTFECHNASYLRVAPDRRSLYAVNEVAEMDGRVGGAVTAFACDPESGALIQIARQPVPGTSPCHLEIHPSGRWLVTSNYSDGTHTVLPILPGGEIAPHAAHRENTGEPGPLRQQDRAHAHCLAFAPDREIAYACDLGLDRVISFRFDEASGALDEIAGSGITLAAGSGPRHLVLHPSLPLIYILNELSSTVSVLRREGEGRLTLLQTISALPEGFSGESWGAAIRLDPSARFLYTSNRGHDSLTSFSADPGDGLLTRIAHTPSGGHWPRDFALLPGDLALVANERSDNLAAFKIGPDGLPQPLGDTMHVPSPTCAAPLDKAP